MVTRFPFRSFSRLPWLALGALLLLIGVALPPRAKPGARPAAVADATAELVTADGTLNLPSGFQGTLDLTTVDRQHDLMLAPPAQTQPDEFPAWTFKLPVNCRPGQPAQRVHLRSWRTGRAFLVVNNTAIPIFALGDPATAGGGIPKGTDRNRGVVDDQGITGHGIRHGTDKKLSLFANF